MVSGSSSRLCPVRNAITGVRSFSFSLPTRLNVLEVSEAEEKTSSILRELICYEPRECVEMVRFPFTEDVEGNTEQDNRGTQWIREKDFILAFVHFSVPLEKHDDPHALCTFVPLLSNTVSIIVFPFEQFAVLCFDRPCPTTSLNLPTGGTPLLLVAPPPRLLAGAGLFLATSW